MTDHQSTLRELIAQSEDADVVNAVTAAMREADRVFEKAGGSTRHHVRDCLLPVLNRAGWMVVRMPVACSLCSEPLRFIDGAWLDAETHSVCKSGHKHVPALLSAEDGRQQTDHTAARQLVQSWLAEDATLPAVEDGRKDEETRHLENIPEFTEPRFWVTPAAHGWSVVYRDGNRTLAISPPWPDRLLADNQCRVLNELF